MKRSTLSTLSLSALSMLVTVGTMMPVAQARPQSEPAFNLQTMRLNELDARNKSEQEPQPYYSQPYYSQPSSQATPQPSSPAVTTDSDSLQTAEPAKPTTWQAPETQAESSSPALSLTQRRLQSLDRN